ncbi:type 1 glutamine amidotransferase domain-containing protein [Rubellicoccus peritrichatus]|uniref:Type 1 glutamine amidotransferase domain-containing protein n=1 Tax=Rubellicoccus peritrichatus TaxID=3080537 RepID=A0AAQ3LBN3_9BACT|nr:type 1 glutamine amidotransferase domain-containing protein [Puniceicoccus sp. CR14]WOO42342.1 type 1 glutamine amidotransferase domain-containing protein [Puniceicoccus sp. CR14]
MMELLKIVILFVVTSHAEMGETGEPTGMWLEEAAAPYYAFIDAGYDVVVASPKGGKTPIDPRSLEAGNQTDATKRFLSDSKARKAFMEAIPLDELSDVEYTAVFLPGGHGPMWDLANNEKLGDILVEAQKQNKPIGAVCHGPAGLLSAKDTDGNWIFADKEMTAFTNSEESAVQLDKVVPFLLETEIVKQGATFSRRTNFTPHVVVDGLLVTGQNPPSSEGTAEEIIRLIQN